MSDSDHLEGESRWRPDEPSDESERELDRIAEEADETNLTRPTGYFAVPKAIRHLLRVD